MIPQAPADFWERVVARVAVLVFERESGRPEAQTLARAGPPAERVHDRLVRQGLTEPLSHPPLSTIEAAE